MQSSGVIFIWQRKVWIPSITPHSIFKSLKFTWKGHLINCLHSYGLLFTGYPLAILYHKRIYAQSKEINHLYIAGCGLLLCVFNYGLLVYHSLLAVLVSYLLITVLNGTPLIAASFAFHMTYLLFGYYYTSTETYDITWTMPHCVLTLKLIGLAFDISDGQRPEQELSATLKKSCVKVKPSLLELAAFTYFPASCLVGPQFSFRRYCSFINKEFGKYTGNMSAGAKRAAVGFIYLFVNVVGSGYLPDNYIYSEELSANHNILSRIFLLGIWSRITLYKYISIWLLTESVAICFGLTFNGVDEKGNADWTGCSNIKLLVFENTRRFQHYIDSFNVQTNHWVAEYIYKRLKFLNNRYMSQLGALIFLAIWHGFHSGYYMCFFMEFSVIICEREVSYSCLQSNLMHLYLSRYHWSTCRWIQYSHEAKKCRNLPQIQLAKRLFGCCWNCTRSLEWASVWHRWLCSVLAAGGRCIARFGSMECFFGGDGQHTSPLSNRYSARPRGLSTKHNKRFRLFVGWMPITCVHCPLSTSN